MAAAIIMVGGNMEQFEQLGFSIDYKYICGRDNYTCQTKYNYSCQSNSGDLPINRIRFARIKPDGPDNESNLRVVCDVCFSLKQEVKPINNDYSGRLVVITGPMFSQKSTTTRALYNKYIALSNKIKPKPYVWLKPELDSRKKGFTQTHDNDLIEAEAISAERPDTFLNKISVYNVVAIDEAQFFSERIIYVLHELLRNGTLVIVNGLKLTANRSLFGSMHHILVEADEIYNLKSVCNACETVDTATRTKSFNSNQPSVRIGGKEQYYAVCPTCDGGSHEKNFLERFVQT